MGSNRARLTVTAGSLGRLVVLVVLGLAVFGCSSGRATWPPLQSIATDEPAPTGQEAYIATDEPAPTGQEAYIAQDTPTATDCAIQKRYDDVTVVVRGTQDIGCARARGLVSYMGGWYTIVPATATQHKTLVCTGTYSGESGTVEVWDTGGEVLGTEICREWNLPLP